MKITFLMILCFCLSGCTFISAPVASVPLGKGVTPITEGVYEVHAKSDAKKPWQLVQTGFRISKESDHYRASVTDDAMTIIPEGEGLKGVVDMTPLVGQNSAEESPQQRFLQSQRGFVLAPLHEDFYLIQMPLTYRAAEFPSKQVKEDNEQATWTLGVVRQTSPDNQTWEFSLCRKCKEASIALYGAKLNCSPGGKNCTSDPKVGDFGSDPEQNRAILERAVKSYGIDPTFKIVAQSGAGK
jgi:hypothetical protein